ncbi:MAG: twin-arginine translocation signal domain-containing protein, partial [Rickettsiales bacterium]|nr:twin-arginine translocation signal domain-containing protein [Rickettsiales bacterium]
MTEQEDTPAERRPIDRRKFLKRTAAMAVGVPVAGYVAAFAAYPEEYRPAGNENVPLSQAAVNAQYNQLYAQMKQAKEHADKSGKKLVVLTGEHHKYTLSLLHKLMITEIAVRLGIKDMVHEAAESVEIYAEKFYYHIDDARHSLRHYAPYDYKDKPYRTLLENGAALSAQHQQDVDMAAALSLLMPEQNKGN